MQLNHLNLTVTDAKESADFLQKYFGMRPMPGLEPKRTFAILRDDAGMILTLMRSARDQMPKYPENFHIGFAQPSEQCVNEINQKLKDDGYEVPPPARLHGSWTFYFEAPGGFTIEVLG